MNPLTGRFFQTLPNLFGIHGDSSQSDSKSKDKTTETAAVSEQTTVTKEEQNTQMSPKQAIEETIVKLSPDESKIPFKLRLRTLTSLDELESEDELYIPRPKLEPGAKRGPGRPKKETANLAQLLKVTRKRGRPRKETKDAGIELVSDEKMVLRPKRSRGRPRKVRDPLISVGSNISEIISRDSKEGTPMKNLSDALVKLKLKECIVEFEESDVLQPSLREDSEFDSGSSSPSYISEDESRDWRPTTRYGGTGRKRGRPKKYDPSDVSQPKKLHSEPRRPRGRPRKNSNELAHPRAVKREGSADGVPRKRGRPRKTQEEIEKKELKAAGIIEFEYDDDAEEDLTNFVFIKAEDDAVKKTRGRPKTSVIEKQKSLIQADVFSSPKKQKAGEILLSTSMSPSKKGIPNLPGSSPSKIPNGRAGSPKKLQKLRQDLQDQSARKRATHVLYNKLMLGDDNDDDYDDEEERKLAERIIEESRKSASAAPSPFNTPRHNRIKGNINLPAADPNFVPTPLPSNQEEEAFTESKYVDRALFLDGPDGYFDQHRTKFKTSNNSMVQAPQLEHDEFNSLVLLSGFLHNNEKSKLIATYKEMYTQWYFELRQGFNLLFFGTGSKRKLLLDFVEEYLNEMIDAPTIVVNGYNPATSFKELLSTIVSTLKLKKVPKRLGDLVDHIVQFYNKKVNSPRLVLLIHNIDGTGLRDEKTQIYLSRLASVRQIYVIASIDHINAPLLWDSTSLNNFSFAWHNTTTFTDYLTETSFQDILTLGQTQKSAGSKGAKYVLSSLTVNSRSLYRVLVSNQLTKMEDDLTSKQAHGGGDGLLTGNIKHALEYKTFYGLCAEEFISSNEINFRTMLMEFVEHKMAVLTKDPSGTEMVFIPFSMEELNQLLEDLL